MNNWEYLCSYACLAKANTIMQDKPCCKTCHVKSSSYFLMLSKEDQRNLNYQKSCYKYKKGQLIFHEENHAIGVYCLHKGKVKISKTGFEGKEQIVRFIIPGELFGIRTIIGAQVYSVNATAIEDSVICFIPSAEFSELISGYPEISKNIILALSDRLLDAENKMTSLAQKPVRERLAESLVFLSMRFEKNWNLKVGGEINEINLSREDLANIVGSATETVIRLLSEFKDEKLIEIKGRKIIIKQKKELQHIANLDF